ncbi:hypothetical protein CDAR_93731 [Caerostris darwini]|uniref:Uncharacterized protein n=1 Tax=Caerostris darwini TaxID=1538125 RepID=A0AAV4NJR2_9ARAC|nr:hypothetical protein CDAR_93731 [Caerostris darwini]
MRCSHCFADLVGGDCDEIFLIDLCRFESPDWSFFSIRKVHVGKSSVKIRPKTIISLMLLYKNTFKPLYQGISDLLKLKFLLLSQGSFNLLKLKFFFPLEPEIFQSFETEISSSRARTPAIS